MINFKTENEPKMKSFDFGAFQKIKKMVSREKIIFHMLFGASHGTPRISKSRKKANSELKANHSLSRVTFDN